jgi:hypothetical protein
LSSSALFESFVQYPLGPVTESLLLQLLMAVLQSALPWMKTTVPALPPYTY